MVKFIIRAEADSHRHYEDARKYAPNADAIYRAVTALVGKTYDTRADALAALRKAGADSACETRCESSAYGEDVDSRFALNFGLVRTGMVEFLTIGRFRMGNTYKLLTVRA